MTTARAAAGGAHPGSQGESRTGLLLAAVGMLTAAAVLSIVTVDYLPTHDGPQHLFEGEFLLRGGEPELGWSRYLEAGAPITSRGSDFVYLPFGALFGWQWGWRLALSATVALWSAGFTACAFAGSGSTRYLSLLAPGLALQWAFYMGFVDFHVASGIGWFALAWALSRREWARRDWLVLGGLLLVTAIAHVFVAEVIGVCVAAVALRSAPNGEWKRRMAPLAAAGAPAACVAAIAWVGARGVEGGATYRLPAEELLRMLAWGGAAGPMWRSVPILLAGVAGALLAWTERGRERASAQALGATSLLCLAAACAAPLNTASWQLFSPRFVPFAIGLGLLAMPAGWASARRVGVALAGACLLWSCAAIGWSARFHRELREAAAPLIGGLHAPVSSDGPRLPVIADPMAGLSADPVSSPVPYAWPLHHAGLLFQVAQGGVTPYSFGVTPVIHPVLQRADAREAYPPVPSRDWEWELVRPGDPATQTEREVILDRLARFGALYDDVIVWGDVRDTGIFRARGYEMTWSDGGLLLARYRGCGALVQFDPALAPEATVHVETAWDGSAEAWAMRHREDFPAEAALFGTLPVRGVPCGSVRMRVSWDVNRSGDVDPGDVVCAQGGSDGVVETRIEANAPIVGCEPSSLLAREPSHPSGR